VRNGTVESQLYAYSSLGAAVVGTTSNHPFLLFSNTVERMRIDASGNVGIGGTPANKFDVFGNEVIARVLDSRATTESNAKFTAQNGNGVILDLNAFNNFGVVNCVSNHRLELRTNNATRILISSDGNVGIGTPSPSSRLHIAGDLTVSSGTTATTASTTAGGSTLPALAAGYLVVSINGTSRKIPYYAT
jgi:hypothetical protein